MVPLRSGRSAGKLKFATFSTPPANAGSNSEVLDTLRAIREALQEVFNKTLSSTLPQIADLMTEVYGRLTQQASFPRVVVESGPTTTTRTVRVRITSDRARGESFEPSKRKTRFLAKIAKGYECRRRARLHVAAFMFSACHGKKKELR